MIQNEHQAIDLLLEDLQTNHYEIRVIAKKLNCENELEKYKNILINYLRTFKHEL